MIERLVENWLDNASEKTFQKPFCYMLAMKGYTILHLTRHCGMEHGKDVIAIDTNNNICAFQLKGAPNSKIKLRQWQEELLGQVSQLIFTPVTHPSANSNNHHLSYLVTNGEIEEEVFNAIHAFNQDWKNKNQPHYSLNTIVKGQLLNMAKELQTDLLPADFNDVKSLLEFYLLKGNGILPKEKLATLLSNYITNFNPNNKAEIKRGISNTALLCSLATSSFSNKNNHVAEVEAWTIYISIIFNLVEKNNLPYSVCRSEINIAQEIIINNLENILEEIQTPGNLIVGDSLTDGFFYNYRITWLMALTSCLGLYYSSKNLSSTKHLQIKSFIEDNIKRLKIWGEAAVPQHIVTYWYYSKVDATLKPGQMLYNLINTICHVNSKNYSEIFFDPYYGIEEAHLITFDDKKRDQQKLSYKGMSHCLEGVVHLYVRENFKQTLKGLWPSISKVNNISFEYYQKSDFLNWRNEEGKEITTIPKQTKEWEELKNEAFESQGEEIPNILKDNFHLFPLFLVVYPHRFSSAGIRWFDTVLKEKVKKPLF